MAELEKAFEKVIVNLSISSFYIPYKDDWFEYKDMLSIVIEEKIIFDKTKKIENISIEKLEDVHLRTLPLLEKYALEDGNYAEQSEIWSDYLYNIRKLGGKHGKK